MCADAECTITITDRIFISTIVEIKRITAKISIRGIESKIHHSDEYTILTFYMKGVLSDDIRVFV